MYNVTSNTASFVRDVLRSDVDYDVPVAFTYKWMYAATSLISTFTIEKSIGCWRAIKFPWIHAHVGLNRKLVFVPSFGQHTSWLCYAFLQFSPSSAVHLTWYIEHLRLRGYYNFLPCIVVRCISHLPFCNWNYRSYICHIFTLSILEAFRRCALLFPAWRKRCRLKMHWSLFESKFHSCKTWSDAELHDAVGLMLVPRFGQWRVCSFEMLCKIDFRKRKEQAVEVRKSESNHALKMEGSLQLWDDIVPAQYPLYSRTGVCLPSLAISGPSTRLVRAQHWDQSKVQSLADVFKYSHTTYARSSFKRDVDLPRFCDSQHGLGVIHSLRDCRARCSPQDTWL